MVLVVILALIWNFSNLQGASNEIAFSDFMTKVADNQVESVTFKGNEIVGKYVTGDPAMRTFRTISPTSYSELPKVLLEKKIGVTVKPETAGAWTTILLSWAPIVLMVGFWVFIMRQMQSGGNKALSFGKSRAKLSSSTQKKVTFKDVAGADEAKDELQEIIEFLREPQKFQKLGG